MSRHAGVAPPTTFGVFFVLNTGFPGSTRSGEKATNTSLPSSKPLAVSFGTSTSLVVPGYVVDSSTTNIPGCWYRAMASVASTMNCMSGSFVLFKGVGTHTTTASASDSTLGSTVELSSTIFDVGRQVRGGNVLDVGFTCAEQANLFRVVVETGNAVARARQLGHHRKTDVANALHHDVGGFRFDFVAEI